MMCYLESLLPHTGLLNLIALFLCIDSVMKAIVACGPMYRLEYGFAVEGNSARANGVIS